MPFPDHRKGLSHLAEVCLKNPLPCRVEDHEEKNPAVDTRKRRRLITKKGGDKSGRQRKKKIPGSPRMNYCLPYLSSREIGEKRGSNRLSILVWTKGTDALKEKGRGKLATS